MSSVVNRDSPVPLYEQVAAILRDEIKGDPASGGKCLEAQQEMAARFGVSLITIRRALQMLADEGVLIMKQGKGTFIREPVLRDELRKLTGVSNIMTRHNVGAEVIVRKMEIIPTPQEVGENLPELLGETCVHIDRLHLVDGIVVGYASLYLRLSYGSRLSSEDIQKHTIYHLYKNKFGVKLGKGIQTIRADRASGQIADILRIPAGTPVLRIDRSAFSASGELIEYMELFYEYNTYAFKVELELEAGVE